MREGGRAKDRGRERYQRDTREIPLSSSFAEMHLFPPPYTERYQRDTSFLPPYTVRYLFPPSLKERCLFPPLLGLPSLYSHLLSPLSTLSLHPWPPLFPPGVNFFQKFQFCVYVHAYQCHFLRLCAFFLEKQKKRGHFFLIRMHIDVYVHAYPCLFQVEVGGIYSTADHDKHHEF
jgi:hypothetical protein